MDIEALEQDNDRELDHLGDRVALLKNVSGGTSPPRVERPPHVHRCNPHVITASCETLWVLTGWVGSAVCMQLLGRRGQQRCSGTNV